MNFLFFPFLIVYYPGLTRLKPVFSQIQRCNMYNQIKEMKLKNDNYLLTEFGDGQLLEDRLNICDPLPPNEA